MPATTWVARILVAGIGDPGPTRRPDNAPRKSGSHASRDSRFQVRFRRLVACVFVRFRAAHYQLAAKEFLVMQLGDRSLRFVHGLHLDESETLRALIMLVAHHFRVLHVANTVEEVKQVALRRIE
jgi:G:T-mismatch repair DNA endonuclease (very short patch repair protein)